MTNPPIVHPDFAVMGPDERTFRAHVHGGRFQRGVVGMRWKLVRIQWPHAIITVAATPRDGAPLEYAFRFELTNYPQVPPTAQPWDVAHDTPLAFPQWPQGRSRVPAAFRPDWHGGQCLYLPCDRISIDGHHAWHSQHPSMIWSPQGDITQYLRILHELLTSSDYTGIRAHPPSP